jgi:hypothetical protein
MDYEELLKKYMEHVGDCEGTTYVDNLNDSWRSDVKFTEEEVAELERIRDLPFP